MATYNSSLFARLENNTGYSKTNESEILNPYVNFHEYANAHTLADSLIAESIQMRGVRCYFIPREFVKPDMLFGEDLQNKFTKAWAFAAYLDSFEGYSGSNSFFSKFGMQVNDEITLSINPGLFKHQTNGTEPKEGDLIYFQMDNSLFEITWVEPYNPFYQVGQNGIRKITAQKFIYSGEEIKPELQVNDGIHIPEFFGLELDPVNNLDGLSDIDITPYAETDEINSESDEFIKAFDVVNAGASLDDPRGVAKDENPFDDF
ncbi:head closure Hc2 [Pseudomonas phage PspYZU05]|uniref:Head completion protein n=1 Tax=Pseudomonas phage PspYZU05 TaxID=1983556 RepID=A0A2U7N2L9_9CAUD|nr:head closure Hc2 [Pseudomonas phage PspYZU05]ASD52075.1 head completion protein [Pseudomonas phage PspYZU05]